MVKEKWEDSTGSYVRIEGDEKDRISDRILMNNCLSHILPVGIEYVNGHREYVYETSGYIPLSKYMEGKELSKKEWSDVFLEIIDIVKELESFLLDGTHLVIDEEELYVGKDGMEMVGIYVPERTYPLVKSLNRIAEKAVRSIGGDRDAAEFIYGFHSLTMNDVTRSEIVKYLRGDKKDVISTDGETINKKEQSSDAGTGIGNITSRISKRTDKSSHRSERSDGMRAYIPSVLSLAMGVIIFLFLYSSGVFLSPVSKTIDMGMLAGAFLFFAAVSGYGCKVLWPKREKTVVFEDESDVNVCLIPKSSGMKLMVIDHFPWKIGRDARRCESIIGSDDIADVHARIIRENKSVYLIDEESYSGTKVNDIRLVPWEHTGLSDGDVISFGEVEYVAEIA